ncbi:MAG: class I SAM-dependent rRNA methyltransferase [Aquificae bacterium]|nr:class I SAM-dependent rRNA methyltransferase [Aquificota bacterium]
MKSILVKKEALEKLKNFFPWIYKNEIKNLPKTLIPGELVEILSNQGELIGIGYANPKSKITVRILTFSKQKIDKNFFREKIEKAYIKRKKLIKGTNAYRIIHSEADSLPGLIVDYYNNYLSLQINTAGMEVFRKEIIQSLIEIIKPFGIYDKSDAKMRDREGLFTENKIIYGEIPDKILVKEENIKFYVYLKEGQKTGAFLDQRKNRKIVSNYVEKDFKVLDIFSNTGGFGIYAYKKGASFVKFVDISQKTINQLKENIDLNFVKNYEIEKEDAFKFLKKELAQKKNFYDLIILDPPPFAKTKHEKQGAEKGFKYLILNSLKLLKKEGMLAVFSCSHHISLKDLKEISLKASKDTNTKIQVLEHMFQDIDHPYILNIPNSLYLKGLLLKKE